MDKDFRDSLLRDMEAYKAEQDEIFDEESEKMAEIASIEIDDFAYRPAKNDLSVIKEPDPFYK